MTTQNDNVWHGAYKIPWDDADFSRRMLAEHLSQDHDMASRRAEWIDRQVAWIHDALLDGQPASVLDLGRGPGFYSHRLTRRGHRCHGIDFGPASIEYAQQHNPDESRCEFVLGDPPQGAGESHAARPLDYRSANAGGGRTCGTQRAVRATV